MRLLNVWTLEVEEFNERDTPPYAILSHTWGSEEVSLQAIRSNGPDVQALAGYQKILWCCEQAKEDALDYAWIDTCCIDKTSSSELAEAINSMFAWYRRSVVCYAFLEDRDAAQVKQDRSLLRGSRWFTRGWTLQELIAPSIVVFFGRGWEEMGVRGDLVNEISAATGIDKDFFAQGKLGEYSVAQRMSWASKRQTTRVEDEAYCLLGLFGVNMPLLYGEGKMAFIRLQEEIMKRSDDQSIFAWRRPEYSGYSGLLAPSPNCFVEGSRIVQGMKSLNRKPFFLTNKGIQITLPVLGWPDRTKLPPSTLVDAKGSGVSILVTPPDGMMAILSCKTTSQEKVAIAIQHRYENEPLRRIHTDLGPFFLDADDYPDPEPRTILVMAHDAIQGDEDSLWNAFHPTFFGIRGLPKADSGFTLTMGFGPLSVNRSGTVVASSHYRIKAGVVFSDGKHAFGILFGGMDDEIFWEVVSGTKEEVTRLAQAFESVYHVPATTQKPVTRVLVNSIRSPVPMELVMETTRRPQGFSSIVRFEE